MALSWIESIRGILYPPTCVLCESEGHDDLDLCLACADALPRISNACSRCAQPLALATTTLCGACQRRLPEFDQAIAIYRYERPVDYMIHQLKFHGRLTYARLLGRLLAQHLSTRSTERPTWIVPVPLHARRVRSRGFNQALELARHLGRRLNLPINHRCVRRVRHTEPQMELPAKARRKNIRGAFAVADGFRASHVVIVDDVMTTGATVDEMARVLKRAGVDRVDVWSVARVA